jgi:hypothetical protein
MSNASADEAQESREEPEQPLVVKKLSQQLPVVSSFTEKTIISPRKDSIGLSLLLGLEENESSRLSLFDDNALQFLDVRD